jgi:hypothetical protein
MSDDPFFGKDGVIVPTESGNIEVPIVSRRRSGASNVAPAHLQEEFINAARAAMGQPMEDDVMDYLGQRVTIVFNGDREPVSGTVTRVVAAHPSGTYLVLDDDEEHKIPLNAIQSIELRPLIQIENGRMSIEGQWVQECEECGVLHARGTPLCADCDPEHG